MPRTDKRAYLHLVGDGLQFFRHELAFNGRVLYGQCRECSADSHKPVSWGLFAAGNNNDFIVGDIKLGRISAGDFVSGSDRGCCDACDRLHKYHVNYFHSLLGLDERAYLHLVGDGL
jgi:hypothetical protein